MSSDGLVGQLFSAHDAIESVERSKSGGPVRMPMSAMQRRYWYLSLDTTSAHSSNICIVRRLDIELDAALLQRCLDHIVARHASLRTTFDIRGDDAVQVVWGEMRSNVECIGSPSTEMSDHEVRSEVRQRADHLFHLGKGPLFHVALIRNRPSESVIVCTFHHIICDGISAQIFLGDLIGTLAALMRTGRPPPQKPVPGYHEMCELARPSCRPASERFWVGELRGAPTITAFPTDFPRPATMRHRGAVHRLRLSPDEARHLGAYARSQHCTEFVLIAAGLAALLHRFTGQEDLVLGTTLTGRDTPQAASVMGCFANLLPLRLTCKPSDDFATFVRQVRNKVLGALEHGNVPFERILELTRPPRSSSHTALFQVLLTYHSERKEQAPGRRSAPFSVQPFLADRLTSRFDLAIDVYPSPNRGMEILAEYDTDLFDAGSVSSIMDCLRHVLAASGSSGTDPIAVMLLGPGAALPDAAWTHRHAADPAPLPMALFESIVARRPHGVAARHEGREIRYAELDRASDDLAARLFAAGLRSGDIAAVHLAPSFAFLLSVLAVLKLGASYLPLNPTHPWPRNRRVLEDAGPTVIITAAEAAVFSADAAVVALDTPFDGGGSGVGGWSRRVARADDPIYVIYTSGSTGLPKGVVVNHGAVANLVRFFEDAFRIGDDDALLGVTPPSFDLGNFDVLLCLCTGATLVIAPQDRLTDPEALNTLARSERVSVMHATPSAYRFYLARGTGVSHRPHRLRLALCGGEQWNGALGSDLCAVADEVWNLYGPTEATVWATAHRIRPHMPIDLGRPIANVDVRVLDARNQPCPQGAVGELIITGACLADGYLNRPALTDERFVLADIDGHVRRAYRTGDKGRQRPNGALQFMGRVDAQLKIRGYRVEPGEIEQVLAQWPEVSAAVVKVEKGAFEDDSRLTAFVVPRARGTLIDLQAVRDHLHSQLPAYLVPSRIVEIDRIPLTPNSKVDYDALRSTDVPQEVVPSPEGEDAAEVLLSAIWKEVLQVPRVAPGDNFFALGGHSLSALQVMIQAERDGLRLTPTDVLTSGSLRGLARLTRRAAAPQAASAEANALHLLDNHAYQVFYLSKMPWAETKLTSFAVPGSFDEATCRRAAQALERRHPILTVVYAFPSGSTVCRLNPDGMADRVSWSGGAATGQASRPAERSDADPLSADYLKTIGVYHVRFVVDGDEKLTHVRMRSEMFSLDRRSLGLIRAELERLLIAGDAAEERRVAGLPYWSYAAQRNADWQRHDAELRPYWIDRARFADWRHLRGSDEGRPCRFTFRGTRTVVDLRTVERCLVESLCEIHRCSEAVLLCSSIVFALHRCGVETSRLPIQLVNDGIECAGASDTVGPLAYAYYFVASFSGGQSPMNFVSETAEAWTAALTHNRVHLRAIWKHVPPPEDRSYEGRLPITYMHNANLAWLGARPGRDDVGIGPRRRTAVDRELTLTTYLGTGHLQLAVKRYEHCLFQVRDEDLARAILEFFALLDCRPAPVASPGSCDGQTPAALTAGRPLSS